MVPYTERASASAREGFAEELATTYLEQYPLDLDGLTQVAMVRLEVEAVRE